jgi:hypothetical protein
VYNPKTQPGDRVGEQDDAVAGVRIVQIAGRYIAGGSDTRSFQHLGQDSSEEDSYFLLDTQTGKQTKFKSYGELLQAASQLSIQLDLKPIDRVYSQYRFKKFDVFVGLLLAIPPLLAVGSLVWWIVRLRRIDEMRPQLV